MNFKTVLLAAAAVGIAGSAQAADLAKKAPAAANYVKVCDAYGAGFFYIPGSETCLKLGGYVRAEYAMFNNNRAYSDGNAAVGGRAFGWGNRTQHGIATRARADLTVDARTATEMGLLRSYIDVNFTVDSTSATPSTALDKAFIQFGGLTAGRATSFFDFYTGTTWGSGLSFEASHSDANINLLAYTFAFGNGISASLSIEDPSTGGRRLQDITGYGSNTGYAGVKRPDLVANVNIAQAWGSAQLMAALHENYTSLAASGIDDSKLGWAIGGGVTVNLPMLGASDAISLQAVYSKGAAAYVSPNWSDFTPVYDFWVGGGSIHQTVAWGVAGGLTHGWTKTLTSNLNASYAAFDSADTAVDDFKQIDLQANLVWAPVSGLSIGAEVDYRKIDLSSAAQAKYRTGDADALVGMIRIQRDF